MKVPISCLPVPKDGKKAVVRFLGAIDGCITHFHPKTKTKPCLGEDCRPCGYPIWKGYAAAQVWDPEKKHWRPVVAEITECLMEILGAYEVRGRVIRMYRVPNGHKGHMATCDELESVDPASLPVAFDHRPPVERMMQSQAQIWGAEFTAFVRKTAEVSEDPGPVSPAKQPSLRDKLDTDLPKGEYRKIIRQLFVEPKENVG